MANSTFYGVVTYTRTQPGNVTQSIDSMFRLHVVHDQHAGGRFIRRLFSGICRFDTFGIDVRLIVDMQPEQDTIYTRELHMTIVDEGRLTFNLKEGPRFMQVTNEGQFLHHLSRFLMTEIPELYTDARRS